MKIFTRKTVLFFLVFFLGYAVFAADIGSDNALTRFNNQVEITDGDRVAGGASLSGGFYLIDGTVTGIFDSFFPVSGTVEFRCGTLSLNQDLIFTGDTTIANLGNIEGNGHILDFSPSVSSWLVGFDTSVCICQVNNIIDGTSGEGGDLYAVGFSANDDYLMSGQIAGATPIRVYSWDGETIVPTATFGWGPKGVLSAEWHPEDYFIAVGRDYGVGNDLVILQYVPGTTTLFEASGINTGYDVPTVRWFPETGDYLATFQDNATQELTVYSVNSSGVINATPVATANLPNPADFGHWGISWNHDGSYIVVGLDLGSGQGEVRVYAFDSTPGSESLTLNATLDVDVVLGYSAEVSAVDWNTTYTDIIAMGLNLGTYRLHVLRHDATAGTLSVKSTVTTTVADVKSLDWSETGSCLAVGCGVDAGETQQELESFRYNSDDFTLTRFGQFTYSQPVFSVQWSHCQRCLAVGTGTKELVVYSAGCGCPEDDCFVWSDLEIFINRDSGLNDVCLTFSGDVTLHGNGHTWDIGPTSTVRVASNSSLALENITITGLDDQNFYCVDDTATISFDNARICLDNDYTFSLGKMDIVGPLELTGYDWTFAYQTSEVSTVSCCSHLYIDDRVTFSYDPPTANKELLQFAGPCAKFILHGGTLHATSTGMTLSNGTLIFENEPLLRSEGTVEAEGILISSDMDVIWNGGSLADHEGPVIYE